MSFIKKFEETIKQRTESIQKELLAEDQVARERFEICLKCEYLLPLTNNCKKCGCFMKAKTKLKKSECPIKKW